LIHHLNSVEDYLKNLWRWDEWKFTENWDNCTLSDVDGFSAHISERKSHFILVEMKHWDGTGQRPELNQSSGQIKALRQLAKTVPRFLVVFGFGDTSTQKVYDYEVIYQGKDYKPSIEFKQMLDLWWKSANTDTPMYELLEST
jgi:hypothetical protein